MGIASEPYVAWVYNRRSAPKRVKSVPDTFSRPRLGLSIVQSIVIAHDGRVESESQVEAGTTVRLSLPPKGNH